LKTFRITESFHSQDCLLIHGRPPANACIHLRPVTSGQVTKMVVTPFDPSYCRKPYDTREPRCSMIIFIHHNHGSSKNKY